MTEAGAVGPTLSPVLVPVQKRIIEWVDGAPVLAVQPVLDQSHVRSLYWIVAAQPYVVVDPLDPDFAKYDGLTIAEVLVRKQLEKAARSGDTGEIEVVMDRLIGKALSKSESVNVNLNGNYETWLRQKAEALKGEVVGAVVEPRPFEDIA